MWIGLLITACYVIAAGAGLDLALSATHSPSEKKEFARVLNERFLRSHGDTTVPVFKVLFGTLESILLRLLGPRLASSRIHYHGRYLLRRVLLRIPVICDLDRTA